MKKKLLALIDRHNAVVDALSECDLPVPEGKVFRAMEIWHKLACEGYDITHMAREAGIDAKCDMQAGRITVYGDIKESATDAEGVCPVCGGKIEHTGELIPTCDCVTSACKSQIKRDPYDPPGTYREKCNAHGWGFVQGVSQAFKEQDEQNQEWGLVLVVPQAVTDSMADMGKKTSYGKMKGGHSDYRSMGYQDGRKFDPTTRLSGAPERAAIGGGC